MLRRYELFSSGNESRWRRFALCTLAALRMRPLMSSAHRAAGPLAPSVSRQIPNVDSKSRRNNDRPGGRPFRSVGAVRRRTETELLSTSLRHTNRGYAGRLPTGSICRDRRSPDRPPGLSTRAISRNATCGSSTKASTATMATTSKLSSRNGSCSTRANA